MFVSNDMFDRWYGNDPDNRALFLQTRPLYRTPVQLHAIKQRQSRCLVYDLNAPDFYGGFTQKRRVTIGNDVRAFSPRFRSKICGVSSSLVGWLRR